MPPKPLNIVQPRSTFDSSSLSLGFKGSKSFGSILTCPTLRIDSVYKFPEVDLSNKEFMQRCNQHDYVGEESSHCMAITLRNPILMLIPTCTYKGSFCIHKGWA